MKWLKHDTDAATDAKLMRVKHKFGFKGYGLYFYVLERIGATLSPDNCTFTLEDDAELISLEWRCDEQEIVEMLDYMVRLKLFTRDKHGRIVCFKLAQRIDKSMTSNAHMRAIIDKIREQLEAGEEPELPPNATAKTEIDSVQSISHDGESGKPMQSHDKPMQSHDKSCVNNKSSKNKDLDESQENPCKPMLDKNRLDKNRLDKNKNMFVVSEAFVEFWARWPRQYDHRKPAFEKFKSKCKNQIDFVGIMTGLKAWAPYLESCENEYRPHAKTWLNQERYNDDAPPPKKPRGAPPSQPMSNTDYGDVEGSL